MRIAIAWATHFTRSGVHMLAYRRLRYSYRAPSLFARQTLSASHTLAHLEFDEELTGADFQGASAIFDTVDLLYLATHGINPGINYKVALYHNDLSLFANSFGTHGPKILVLDTCTVIDTTKKDWYKDWESPLVGPALRLILGFRTPATVAHVPSIRGTAFAREMEVSGFTDAWFAAIPNSTYIGTDKPIAISFGNDDADARSVLTGASVTCLPGPRIATTPKVAWRF